VCAFIDAFYREPRSGAVYNLGGGRANSVSMLEAIARLEERIGNTLSVEYVDRHRVGDHICYISDLRKAQSDYPGWGIEYSLDRIVDELGAVGVAAQTSRRA
jgi:CDP-paratose 2-epimerase